MNPRSTAQNLVNVSLSRLLISFLFSGSGTGERRKQKPHRFKPRTQALREIRHLQKTVNLLTPAAPFIRTVKEISNYIAPEVTRWQAESSMIIAIIIYDYS
ncbi:hypothetical protein L2E82_38548 [Cichorium intybus]|uniref:Uncharacterized protein n=1 Tax=Cichorium intybus TaxID=13427 RepID=A0ACB9AKH7_CICIN|nr:hypothetical protein L2E82_38548 [Cichorium intybus]